MAGWAIVLLRLKLFQADVTRFAHSNMVSVIVRKSCYADVPWLSDLLCLLLET